MDSQVKKYQNILLSQGTGDAARNSETVAVRIGEEEVDIEVRCRTITEGSDVTVPDKVADRVDGEVNPQIVLIAKCCYIPDTDKQIFTEPEHIARMHEAPADASGWVSRLGDVVDYVHGYRKDPPDGVRDPRLKEIAATAEQLEALAADAKADGETLPVDEVEFLANEIKLGAQLIDQGGAEKKPIADMIG